uniref:Uncharacterized protein n=1 Tax=Iridovirus sp. TaxID=135728 RepID=A0AAU7YCY7_9VIRU
MFPIYTVPNDPFPTAFTFVKYFNNVFVFDIHAFPAVIVLSLIVCLK